MSKIWTPEQGAFSPLARPDGLNAFGGLNPNGLYVPMSEDEQEVLQRLIDTDDLEVVAHGWGTLHEPQVIAGDHRVGIKFTIDFRGSGISRPLHYLDLELRTRSGLSLFREKKALDQTVMVSDGMFIEWQWDIAIHSMDPKLVRMLKPGATGLTSRRQDKDTQEMTSQGNMKLDGKQKKLLRMLESDAKGIRKEDQQAAVKAVVESGDLQR